MGTAVAELAPVDRAALLLVEMQNDIVHESNVGERGLGGVLAMQVQKRGVIPKLQALTTAARARGVPVLYVNFCGKPGFPRPNTRLHRVSGSKPRLVEGTWGVQVHEALTPRPEDFVLERTVGVDGSYGTQLYPVLRQLGRTTMLMTGVSTNLAVEGIVDLGQPRLRHDRGEDCCASYPTSGPLSRRQYHAAPHDRDLVRAVWPPCARTDAMEPWGADRARADATWSPATRTRHSGRIDDGSHSSPTAACYASTTGSRLPAVMAPRVRRRDARQPARRRPHAHASSPRRLASGGAARRRAGAAYFLGATDRGVDHWDATTPLWAARREPVRAGRRLHVAGLARSCASEQRAPTR
jgi:nicotinamidase-related amidase